MRDADGGSTLNGLLGRVASKYGDIARIETDTPGDREERLSIQIHPEALTGPAAESAALTAVVCILKEVKRIEGEGGARLTLHGVSLRERADGDLQVFAGVSGG